MKKSILTLAFCLGFAVAGMAQQVHERLYTAVTSGDVKTASQLLREKADPNAAVSSGPWMKVSLLTLAVLKNNNEMARLLIKHKADVNQKDGFNTSPLMYAAAQGNKELVLLLLKNGADVQANDGNNNSVLTAALESNNPEIVALVEEKIKTRQKQPK
ncbi:MAG TPA: ankyrin repeat domain-containing protein [Adhaeribacter sp.]|nr:ankyrin repeat domain-containing protein [Adhaeribacter sp.]